MKTNIMFVNDSIKVLESLKRFFNDETYHFFGFDNPFEALDKMKEAKFAVVVAGQSMSKIGVIEFFKKTKQLSPNTVGIVLTSCFELDNASDAFDNGLIYRFSKKPWNDLGLKQAVEMAITHYEMNNM
jgi:two-component system, NtrC family, response regulator AtoC